MEPTGIQILREKFSILFPMTFLDGRILIAVKRHEIQMVLQKDQYFVDVRELTPLSLNIDPVNEGELYVARKFVVGLMSA
jgi:hypothetical protein